MILIASSCTDVRSAARVVSRSLRPRLMLNVTQQMASISFSALPCSLLASSARLIQSSRVISRTEQERWLLFLLRFAYIRKLIEQSWHWCSSSSAPTTYSRTHGELHQPIQDAIFCSHEFTCQQRGSPVASGPRRPKCAVEI